ncbi:MAG: hypothetical protein ABIT10_05555 [Alteraurantiacibacter sp.]
MKSILFSLLGTATLVVAVPAVAGTTADVDCVRQSYGSEGTELIATLVRDPSFSGIGAKSGPVGEALGQLIQNSVRACGEEHGWSPEQLLFAVVYEVGRLTEEALRVTGGLTAPDINKLDVAITAHDNAEIWQMLERVMMATLGGDDEADSTPGEDTALRDFVQSAGLNTNDATVLSVGTLMGAIAMQRVGLREFESLRGGN